MDQPQKQHSPKHAEPMSLHNIIARAKLGKRDEICVQMVGKVTKVILTKTSVGLKITDESIKEVVLVQKSFCNDFKKEDVLKINVDDYVVVVGKIKYCTDGMPEMHASSIQKTIKAQFTAFKQFCAFSKMNTNTVGSTGA